MIHRALASLALVLAAPAGATTPSVPPPDRMASVSGFHAAAKILSVAGFGGVLAVETGEGIVQRRALPDPALNRVDSAWPWASVTKQVLAVMTMQAVERGAIGLDDPAARYLPELGTSPTSPTVRQLLQHRSGLRNPDDSPEGVDGWPTFYTDGPTGLDWCVSGREGPPAEGWSYNNCDFFVMGAVLEKATGQSLPDLFRDGIANRAGLSNTAFMTIDTPRSLPADEERYPTILARFGAAGGLVGPVADLLRFDRALLDGKLLSDAGRAELWRAEPALGYMALGQCLFEAPLKGCSAPVRIVERRGAIGTYQVRNLILPGSGMTIAIVADRPEEAFAFGEIWTGSGVMHDVLFALACTRT